MPSLEHFFTHVFLPAAKSVLELQYMVWLYLLSFFVSFIIRIVFKCYKGRQLKSYLYLVLTVETLVFILSMTIFSREPKADAGYNFTPLWSYGFANSKGDAMLVECLQNVILFIPVGFFVSGFFNNLQYNKRNIFLRTICFGCALSVIIELLQLILKRGFCETDDVIHNTIGVFVGFLTFQAVSMFVKTIRRLIKS